MDELGMEESANPKAGGSLTKLLVVLFLGSLLIGFGLVFGGRAMLAWYAAQPSFTQSRSKIQESASSSQIAALTLPADFSYAGLYHAPLDDKDLDVFVVTADKTVRVLPKDLKQMLELGVHDAPLTFIFCADGKEARLDADIKTAMDQFTQQGRTALVQDKIWISEKETPASINEITKADKIYQVVLVRSYTNVALLSVALKDPAVTAPGAEIIAALFRVNAAAVSFSPPEPAGLKLARAVLSPDVSVRKKAVTDLATIGGAQPEAVSFLATSLAGAAPDVKIDIVDALGFLAKTNQDAIPPVIQALNDKSTRMEAIAALGSLGPAAGAAIPALKKIVANKKEIKQVRMAANNALSSITGRPQPPLDAKTKGKSSSHKKGKH